MSSLEHNRKRNVIRRQANIASRAAAPKHGASWTQAELEYLTKHFTHATAAVVATALGRTVEACTQMFYMKPERASQDRHQERHTTQKLTRGQQEWEKGFTSLDSLDREVDFSKLGW